MEAGQEDENVLGRPLGEVRDLLADASGAEVITISRALARELRWKPLPHQVPPAWDEDWDVWLLLGGRGAGKTDAAAAWVSEHVHGPPCDGRLPGGHRVAVIAPTLGDAVDACVKGPSGLLAHGDGDAVLVGGAGGTEVRWKNGAVCKLFGAYTPRDVDRLRAGGNRCMVWAEEVAAWPELDDAYAHARLGLRIGPRPRMVCSTTPKPRALLRRLIGEAKVRVTRATTDDNPYLDRGVRDELYRMYEGTRLGRQELLAELLDAAEGALWQPEIIGHCTGGDVGRLLKVVVGVDPSAWGPDDGGSDRVSEGRGIETGIVVAGLGEDDRVYVLEDVSGRLAPDVWARRAVSAVEHWEAPRKWVAAETNMGNALVTAMLRGVNDRVRVVAVRASESKRARAEPVALLYEQGRVTHVGSHPVLEDQMCSWDPSQKWSPDRVDALVWAITSLDPWKKGRPGTGLSVATGLPPLRV